MIAVSFFDAFARDSNSTDGADPGRSAEVARLAKTYVDSALADWQRVLECEDRFGYRTFPTQADESEANRALYQVYQTWAAEAEQVLLRVRPLAGGSSTIESAEDLEHAFGRVQARLKMTPDMFDRAREEIRQGRGIPMEDIRNGLRARVRT